MAPASVEARLLELPLEVLCRVRTAFALREVKLMSWAQQRTCKSSFNQSILGTAEVMEGRDGRGKKEKEWSLGRLLHKTFERRHNRKIIIHLFVF